MLIPQGLTVFELIDTINDLVISKGRRPTVDEVIAEVLARLAARLQISRDPSMLPQSSIALEQDLVTSLRQATSHPTTSRPGTVLKRNSIASPKLATSHGPTTSPNNLNSSRTGTILSAPDWVAPPRHTSNSTRPGTSLSGPSMPCAASTTSAVVTPHGASLPVVHSGRYYAVIRGRRVGVFPEPFEYVKKLIEGAPNNYHRGFKTKEKAAQFYYEQKSKGNVAIIRTSTQDDDISGPAEVEP